MVLGIWSHRLEKSPLSAIFDTICPISKATRISPSVLCSENSSACITTENKRIKNPKLVEQGRDFSSSTRWSKMNLVPRDGLVRETDGKEAETHQERSRGWWSALVLCPGSRRPPSRGPQARSATPPSTPYRSVDPPLLLAPCGASPLCYSPHWNSSRCGFSLQELACNLSGLFSPYTIDACSSPGLSQARPGWAGPVITSPACALKHTAVLSDWGMITNHINSFSFLSTKISNESRFQDTLNYHIFFINLSNLINLSYPTKHEWI